MTGNPLDSFYKFSADAISDEELEQFAMAVMEHLLNQKNSKKADRALSFSRIIRRIYNDKRYIQEVQDALEEIVRCDTSYLFTTDSNTGQRSRVAGLVPREIAKNILNKFIKTKG